MPARAAYINLVSASDVASREYPAVSQMDVSVGKKVNRFNSEWK